LGIRRWWHVFIVSLLVVCLYDLLKDFFLVLFFVPL
jgi:hypothetical protein